MIGERGASDGVEGPDAELALDDRAGESNTGMVGGEPRRGDELDRSDLGEVTVGGVDMESEAGEGGGFIGAMGDIAWSDGVDEGGEMIVMDGAGMTRSGTCLMKTVRVSGKV